MNFSLSVFLNKDKSRSRAQIASSISDRTQVGKIDIEEEEEGKDRNRDFYGTAGDIVGGYGYTDSGDIGGGVFRIEGSIEPVSASEPESKPPPKGRRSSERRRSNGTSEDGSFTSPSSSDTYRRLSGAYKSTDRRPSAVNDTLLDPIERVMRKYSVDCRAIFEGSELLKNNTIQFNAVQYVKIYHFE